MPKNMEAHDDMMDMVYKIGKKFLGADVTFPTPEDPKDLVKFSGAWYETFNPLDMS